MNAKQTAAINMDSLSAPKVLLLGISYPDVKGHMAKHEYDDSILQNSELSVDQAVECVRRKILTEMDGRDLARCVATEQAGGGHEVYTVSKEMGGIYRSDRHVYASFNNSRLMRRAMAKAFGQIQFQQVILDYYWMPTGWLVTRWAKTLFQETLPDLVKYNLLAYPGSRQRTPRKSKVVKTPNASNSSDSKEKEMELEEGVVFLPFCAHVCKELVGGIDILEKYYAITFVKKSELPGHVLWKGTMNIDGKVMQHRLGKRLDQEEIYCTFQPKDIYESMEDAHVDKDEVMKMLLSIEDFENIRMIRLRPLCQHEPPSVFRNACAKKEVGGFLGLNWEKGRQLFKEYRGRKNKPRAPPPAPAPSPSPSPTPSPAHIQKQKSTKITRKEEEITYDSGSEVQTEDSDFEDSSWEIDTESDSSDDEESVDRGQKAFDPLDPNKIPMITNYYPYPALDMESYTNVKEIVDDDRVMASWAKTWGPKSSRKKNRKQDISKDDYMRFRETQRDYLSRNSRLPDPEMEQEDGYKWTLVDEMGVVEKDDGEGERNTRNIHHPVRGWKRTLKGDDPDGDRMPKIIELAKRDNEMTACCQLFEMKNPGLKTFSRAWLANSFLSCYQIPQHAVLKKIGCVEKATEKSESKYASEKTMVSFDSAYNQYDPSDDCEVLSDSGSVVERNVAEEPANHCVVDSPSTLTASILFQFADLASSAPTLSDDFRAICKGSKGLLNAKNDFVLPPFKPRLIPNPLDYNLNQHKDFPRELFRLLQDAEEKIIDHIICWQERGRSFIVKHHEPFETVVLGPCCKGNDTSYKSFLRNITSYGFTEIQVGKSKGGYRHNLFQRGKPRRLDLLIKRFNAFSKDGGVDRSVESKKANKSMSHKIVDEGSSRKQFIENLHEFLRKSESLGFGDAIHWEEDGTSFRVHKTNESFTTKVLKDFFSMCQYSKFKEELMDRGFKCKEGKKYGIFKHPSFTRSQRNDSDSISEIKLKKRKMQTCLVINDNPDGRKKTRKSEPERKITTRNIYASPSKNARSRPKRLPEKLSQVHSISSSQEWTPVEHQLFIEAYSQFGRNWTNIAKRIRTRNSTQVRHYAIKYDAMHKQDELPTPKIRQQNLDVQTQKQFSKRKPTVNEQKQDEFPTPKIPQQNLDVQTQKQLVKRERTLNQHKQDGLPTPKIPQHNLDEQTQKELAKRKPTVNEHNKDELLTPMTPQQNLDEQTQKQLAKQKPTVNEERRYDVSRSHNFPTVLHTILEQSEEEGHFECIRWSPQGDSFVVNKLLFVKKFLCERTNITRFSTFEGVLKWLGFENLNPKKQKNRRYHHPDFIRGNVAGLRLLTLKVADPKSNTEFTSVQETPPSEPSDTERRSAKSYCVEVTNGKKRKSEKLSNVSDLANSPCSESKAPIMSTKKENTIFNNVTGSGIITPINSETSVESSTTDSDKCTNGDDSEKSEPASDTESEPRLRNSSSGITSKTFQGDRAYTKKRKTAQKSRGPTGVRKHTAENNHGSAAMKLDVVPEEYGQAMSSHERSLPNGVQEVEEKSAASDPRKGHGSRNKVCHINTSPMDPLQMSSIESRHTAKNPGSNFRSKRSSASNWTHFVNGCKQRVEMHSMSSRFPHSLFDPDRRIGRQMNFSIDEPNRITGECMTKGMTPYSAHASILHLPKKNAMQDTRYDPSQSDLRNIFAERLRGIGLSWEAFSIIVSKFSSRMGEARASVFEHIVYFRADIPIEFEPELNLLADSLLIHRNPECMLHSSVEDLGDFLLECMLLEVCLFKFRRMLGKDWGNFIFQVTVEPSVSMLFHKRLLRTCRDSAPDLIQIRSEIMDALTEHKSRDRERLAWADQKLVHKRKEMELRLYELEHEMEQIHKSDPNGRHEVERSRTFDNNDSFNNALSPFDHLLRNDGCNNGITKLRMSHSESSLNSFASSGGLAFTQSHRNVEYERQIAESALPVATAKPRNVKMTTMKQQCAFAPARADLTTRRMPMVERQRALSNAIAARNTPETETANRPCMLHSATVYAYSNIEEKPHHPFL